MLRFLSLLSAALTLLAAANVLPRRALKNEKAPEVRVIPLHLFQSHKSENRPPAEVVRTWMDASPGLSYTFLGDCEAQEYLRQRWGERYAAAHRKIAVPAIASDFFRLCYLAKEGGFWADADKKAGAISLRELQYLSPGGLVLPATHCFNESLCVWNAFMGAAPGHPAMMDAARRALERVEASFANSSHDRDAAMSVAGPRALASLLFEDGVTVLSTLGEIGGYAAYLPALGESATVAEVSHVVEAHSNLHSWQNLVLTGSLYRSEGDPTPFDECVGASLASTLSGRVKRRLERDAVLIAADGRLAQQAK